MSNHFRRRDQGPRLSPREAERQGRISVHALSVLGREEAIAFLNTAHEALGGRPLDLAIGSDEGLSAVEQYLAAHAART